jgi:branched-chain amino acid transport system substrate-binding protein
MPTLHQPLPALGDGRSSRNGHRLGGVLAFFFAAVMAAPALAQNADPGAGNGTVGKTPPASQLAATPATSDTVSPAGDDAARAAANGAAKYDIGASDTEIKIGNTVAYTGPDYSLYVKGMAAYFAKVNAEGGINGRKIKFFSYDDAYDPQKTVAQTRRLVEEDKVLLIFGSLGTATNDAIRGYLNEQKVPHLFLVSGDSRWDSPAEAPWSMGWLLSYRTEGRIYGQYVVQNDPKGKVAVLYQNDALGKDALQGMKDGLGGKVPIVAEVPYDLSDTSLLPQLQKLKASGADILFDASTPKFAPIAIREVAQIGWKPQHILLSIAANPDRVLKSAGFDISQGILTGYYVKDVSDPAFRDDPGVREWNVFAAKYLQPSERSAVWAAYGYSIAQTMMQVLKQCGNDLTRKNIMQQAASLKGLKLPLLVNGININTSASDYAPVEQMQMARVVGEFFEPFGPVLSGVNPGAVSEGFKTIFQYGSGAAHQTAARLNKNTVTMMTGTLGGTYEEIGADLATVLDDGDNLRVLPALGRGSVQGVADVLYLKGVDVGIVRADTLDYLERNGYAPNIRPQFAYITKLFNEEMHIIAPKSVDSIGALDGKTVAIGLSNGGTFVTAINVFERLGIRPHFLYIEQRVALDKLRRGEIDAVIAVEAKPVGVIGTINDPNLHFVPVDYSTPLQADYLPGTLTADDYPGLIPKGGRVHTISVASVLAAYNWPANTERYRRLENFVEALFTKLPQLQQPPFHPKWRDVSLNAKMPGWTRFKPAEDWLNRQVVAEPAVAESSGSERAPAAKSAAIAKSDAVAKSDAEDSAALFREFLEWRKSRQR